MLRDPMNGNLAARMQPELLIRQLRRLKRTVDMLDTEFAQRRVDEGLLAELDLQLENGLANEPRAAELKPLIERLRENTLTPRTELYADGMGDCRRLKAAIEGLIAVVA